MTEARFQLSGKLLFGLTIIAVGLLLTLDNLGLADTRDIVRWCPIVLVAYGLMRVTGWGCRRGTTAGMIFLIVGSWLLLGELDILRVGIWNIWPLILILIGGSIVLGALRRRLEPEPAAHQGPTEFSSTSVFSGVERKVTSTDYRGGELTAVFGGHKLDLRGARMSAGTATLELTVIFGGVEIIVPEDWQVTSEATVILAGVEDHSRHPGPEVKGHLILKGSVIMGGVEVKN